MGWGGVTGFEGYWGRGGCDLQNQTSPDFRFQEVGISVYTPVSVYILPEAYTVL